MKPCKVCKIEKPLSDYYSAKGCKDGTWHTCKKCTLKKQNEYNNSRKDIRKITSAKLYLNKKDIILAKNKEWRLKNPERAKKIILDWNNKNKERVSANAKRYYNENKDRHISIGNKYKTNRLRTDELFKLKVYLRNRTRQCFNKRGFVKSKTTTELLGVDFNTVKLHIEKKFIKGMSWENYGDWHIDHEIPLASAKTKEELKALCHYTNLQPLWALDNIMKSDNMPQTQMKIAI